MKFITNEPVLSIGRALIISDLHLGIEYDFYRSGIRIPSQTGRVAKRIIRLLEKTGCERLVMLGDIKHKVPGSSFQEARELPKFFSALSEKAEVEIIKGNHDGGIERFASGIRIHPGKGFLLGKHYLCHGHARPGKEILEAEFLITGHSHSVIEITDELGYKWSQKAWIRAPPRENNVKEIIFTPAFSEFVGGKPINGLNPLGPVMRMADLKKAEIYLLDGTHIGNYEIFATGCLAPQASQTRKP